MLPWPLVTLSPSALATATPPPLSSTIRQLATSWRFLFRHRRQRNSTFPFWRWKLPIMACFHLSRHCRPYTRLDEPIIRNSPDADDYCDNVVLAVCRQTRRRVGGRGRQLHEFMLTADAAPAGVS